MKDSIIAQLIAGFLNKNPKRIKIFQWVVGIITAISALLTYAAAQHLFNVPDVFNNVIAWVVGIATAVGALIGSQLAKKDGTTDSDYPQLTETERLAINTSIAGAGYVCYQTDTIKFPVGYYQINTSLTWDYAGSRPPHR